MTSNNVEAMNSILKPFRFDAPLICIDNFVHDVSQKLVKRGVEAKKQLEKANKTNEGETPGSYDTLLTPHFALIMAELTHQAQLHTVVHENATKGYVYLHSDVNAVESPNQPSKRINIDLLKRHPCDCGHSKQGDTPCPHTIAFVIGERARANCKRANQQAPAHIDSYTSNSNLHL